MKTSFKIYLLVTLFFASLIGTSINQTTTASAVSYTFTNNLTIGARGNDVSALQQFLISGGFLNITAPTGYFGPLTKTALGKWQTSENIYPTAGFFGPLSRTKLNMLFSQAPIPPTLIQSATTTPIIIVATSSSSTTAISLPANETGLPKRLKIPKLGVDANILSLGFASAGVMEIPNNIYDVGWFNEGPRPGEKGSSVITGHVAQIRGGIMTKPGVFMELNKLTLGDKLYVVNDKGESTTFVVRESRLYDPSANSNDVFSSSDGGAHLNLITCEGTWNPTEQSYSKRLVIFTDLEK